MQNTPLIELDDGSQKASAEIALMLVEAGHITQEQLDYALRIRSKIATAKPLAIILQELEYITSDQLTETLTANRISIQLGTLLAELGVISETELQSALALQKEKPGTRLGEILIDNHLVNEDELLQTLSVQMGYKYYNTEKLPFDKRLVRRAKPDWYKKNGCYPIYDEDGTLLLALIDPMDEKPLADSKTIFGQVAKPCLARKHVIQTAIRLLSAPNKDTEIGAGDSDAVKAVNMLLVMALDNNASDIHIEPMKEKIRVRMRQDGVLVQKDDLPLALAPSLTSRIKIMAGADIAERRRHQGGRMLFEHEGSKIDLRVSFYSTIHGEKIVLRLLNNRSNLLDIEEIGMAPKMAKRFREDVLDVPSGVVLVTGPTGSGKTTTLYAAINYLNNVNTSIITAEDPVEYVISGISQCSINPKINITYEETLRHVVRQDPDVIVIGEIRDQFSADTAIQAALTGHKVITTFHTEDSIGGLLRLLHMNIEAFLISSTVVSVVAQRLVRRVCPSCSYEHVLTPDEIRRLGYNPRDVSRLVFARGRGCTACHHAGYKGRIAVFELLVLNEDVKEALIQRKTSFEIRNICTESTGLVSLLEDAIVKASHGLTSFDEIIRALPRLAAPRPPHELHRLQGAR